MHWMLWWSINLELARISPHMHTKPRDFWTMYLILHFYVIATTSSVDNFIQRLVLNWLLNWISSSERHYVVTLMGQQAYPMQVLSIPLCYLSSTQCLQSDLCSSTMAFSKSNCHHPPFAVHLRVLQDWRVQIIRPAAQVRDSALHCHLLSAKCHLSDS